MTAQKAVDEIVAYINNNGGVYSAWYVGITSDYKQRLFTSHAVDERSGAWICCPCDSATGARNAERHFLERLMCKGGPGGGDDASSYIYAYKVTPGTFESV